MLGRFLHQYPVHGTVVEDHGCLALDWTSPRFDAVGLVSQPDVLMWVALVRPKWPIREPRQRSELLALGLNRMKPLRFR